MLINQWNKEIEDMDIDCVISPTTIGEEPTRQEDILAPQAGQARNPVYEFKMDYFTAFPNSLGIPSITLPVQETWGKDPKTGKRIVMAHPAYDQCIKASHMFNLLAQHLIYCPKIKFEALSPSQGSTHKNSIQITSQIVLNGLDALVLFIKSSNVTSKFDLKKSKFELTTLMLAILLLEDQKTRQKAIQTFMKIAEMDHDGVIIGIIDEYMQGQKEIYKTRNQNSMVRDVIDLIGIQLE